MEECFEETPDERCNILPLQLYKFYTIEFPHIPATAKEYFNSISEKYGYYRRVRGDGNCFYRSLIYSYLELLIMKGSNYLTKFYTL